VESTDLFDRLPDAGVARESPGDRVIEGHARGARGVPGGDLLRRRARTLEGRQGRRRLRERRGRGREGQGKGEEREASEGRLGSRAHCANLQK
jgi:hypothetical protein